MVAIGKGGIGRARAWRDGPPMRTRSASHGLPYAALTLPELETTLGTGQDRLFRLTPGLGQTVRIDLSTSKPSAATELFIRRGADRQRDRSRAATDGRCATLRS